MSETGVRKLYLNLLGCLTMSTDKVIEQVLQPVARGQNVVRDTVLCRPQRHLKGENVFLPFPGKAERKRRRSIENF